MVLTDDDGIARAARVVPAGLYVCAVENQDDLVVPTVADFADAYPVVLPVGRSYVDLNDGVEFGSQDENEDESIVLLPRQLVTAAGSCQQGHA